MSSQTRGKDMPAVGNGGEEPQRLPTRRSVRWRDMEDTGSSEAFPQSTTSGSLVRTSLFHTPESRETSLQPSQQTQGPSPQQEPSQQTQGSHESHDTPSTFACNSLRRGRGRAKQIKGWGKQKLICKWNEKHQPLGKEARKLSTQLGNFARNGSKFPLTKTSWDGQDPVALEAVWNEVKANTNAPDEFKKICFTKINMAWKKHKSEIKKKYLKYETDEERLANVPDNVEANDWSILVRYWGLPEVVKEAQINKQNREMLCAFPRTGRVPFADIHEERESRQESTDHISMWRHTRKVKNKSGGPDYFSQEDGAAGVDVQFETALLDLPEEERENPIARETVFKRVIGEDGHGRMHMMGVGITPSSPRSDSSSIANNYDERVRVEIKRLQREFTEREHLRVAEAEKRLQAKLDQRMKQAEQRYQEDIARLRADMTQLRTEAEESLVQKFMAFANPHNASHH